MADHLEDPERGGARLGLAAGLAVVMVVFVSLVLAVALEPVVEWLERRRFKRGLAVLGSRGFASLPSPAAMKMSELSGAKLANAIA